MTRPVPHKKHKGEDTPVELFPDLKDPLEVTRLEIVQYDEASQQCKKPFEVAQVTGRDGKTRWAIPSHFDYPADAKDHLAEAASLLMGIKSMNTAPGMDNEHGELDQDNIRRLHNEYGVVDPDPATVKIKRYGRRHLHYLEQKAKNRQRHITVLLKGMWVPTPVSLDLSVAGSGLTTPYSLCRR